MQTSGWSLPLGILSKAPRTVTVTTKRETKQIGKSRTMGASRGTLLLISPRPSCLLAGPRRWLQGRGWGEENTKVLSILGLALGTADNAQSAEKI